MTLIGRTQLETALRALPSHDELLSAAHWTRTNDPSAGFESLLVDALRQLGVEDADASLD